ncbi:MAG: hypothetical protein OXI15_14425 [Chromatiales bacterium]|nr:hypothetical protein [Chromatiales bacterium]
MAHQRRRARISSSHCAGNPHDPPARSAVVNDLLVDVRVEVEAVAFKPQ